MAEGAQVQELLQKMALERDRLLKLLESLGDKDASTPPSPGEWNAKQQMSHLCEMETAYRAWVRRALEEDGANVDGVRGEPPAIPLEEANRHSLSKHLAEMRRQRAQTVSFIGSMKLDDFQRTASNSFFGTLTVLQWLRSYYRHDRMHCDQVQGQEVSYKPRYRSGSEPDQRRGASA